jgi:hypothetical protein
VLGSVSILNPYEFVLRSRFPVLRAAGIVLTAELALAPVSHG